MVEFLSLLHHSFTHRYEPRTRFKKKKAELLSLLHYYIITFRVPLFKRTLPAAYSVCNILKEILRCYYY
jgi:hypothetical protein